MSTRKHVNLEQSRMEPNKYVVKSTENVTTPKIGETLTETKVNELRIRHISFRVVGKTK